MSHRNPYRETLDRMLVKSMEDRLTHPLSDNWQIAFPFTVQRMTCMCGEPVKTIRVNATDCDAWGMRTIDGAISNIYGTFCSEGCSR